MTAEIDASRFKIQKELESIRHSIARKTEQQARDPAWQSVPYDLVAAVFQSSESEWIYVRHDTHTGEHWWCLEDAVARSADADTILTDTTGAKDGRGVALLVYTQRSATERTTALSGTTAVPQPLTALCRAIERDNQEARRSCQQY